MLLEIVSLGLIGAVAYSVYYPGSLTASKNSSTSDVLNGKINNDFIFRDITYTDKIELAHPDVRNNSFYYQGAFAQDRGNNGIPRKYSQLYEGSSEITQLSLQEHLFL